KKQRKYLKWQKNKEKKENNKCKNNNCKHRLKLKKKLEKSKEKNGLMIWKLWRDKKLLKLKENFRNKLCYLLGLMRIKIWIKMECQMYWKYIKQELMQMLKLRNKS